MGCSDEHKLIADYLDLLDSEPQLHSNKLGPNTRFYLPTLFHFLVNKLNKPDHPNTIGINTLMAHPDKVFEKKPSPDITVSSSSFSQISVVEGSLNITSNIRKTIDGKVTLSSEDKSFTPTILIDLPKMLSGRCL